MDPRDAGHLALIGFLGTIVGMLFMLWRNVPEKKIEIGLTVLLTCVAGTFGGLLWIVVLGVLKQWNLEPQSTSSFGGVHEVHLVGGAFLGFFYFLPITALLTFIDVKLREDSWNAALLTNFAFLVGCTIGGAFFYGSGFRALVSLLKWSQLKQETALVLAWSGIIIGSALALYAAVSAIVSKTSPCIALARAMLISLVPMFICYITVFTFLGCCTTVDQPREDARGIFVGFACMLSITWAHEMLRVWAAATRVQSSATVGIR